MKKYFKIFIPILVILFFSGCNSNDINSNDINSNDINSNDINSNDIIGQQGGSQYGLASGNFPILNNNKKNSVEGVEIRGGFIANSNDDSPYYRHENIYVNEKLNIRYFIQPTSTEKKEFGFGVFIYSRDEGKLLEPTENGAGQWRLIDSKLKLTKNKTGQWRLIGSESDYHPFKQITLSPSSKPIRIDLSLNLSAGYYEVFYTLHDPQTQKLLAEIDSKRHFPAEIHTKDQSTLKNANAQSIDFLPKPDGFGFSNIGDVSPNDISPQDVAHLIGTNNACYNSDPNNCIPTAIGVFKREQYISQEGGQCYGFAIAAMMLHQGSLFKGKSHVSDYNSETSQTFELKKHNVANLIALKYLNQRTPEIQNLMNSKPDTLNEYRKILNGFNGDDPIAVLAFFDIKGNAGHAVTPYAITQEEKNKARIYIYDNNLPGRDDLYFDINLDSGHWTYTEGATNAQDKSSSKYYGEGKQNPFFAIPLSLTQHEKISDDLTFDKIKYTLKGESKGIRMFISQDSEHHIGYNFKTGQYVNNIEGAEEFKNFENTPSDYLLPLNPNLTDILSIKNEAEFNRLLEEYQTVEIGTLSNKENDAADIRVSMQASSPSFNSALSFDIPLASSDKFNIAFHPKGRMFFFELEEESDTENEEESDTENEEESDTENEEESYPKATIHFDDRELMRGYIYEFTFKDIPDGVMVAALVVEDAVSIFAMKEESDEIIELNKTTNYTVKRTIVDQYGRQEMSKQTLSQPINSGMRLRSVYNPSGIQAKSKGQDVVIERIF